MEFTQNILLTGAGFTKNFGGLLASEMWSKIYNHPMVQGSPRLISLLQDNFDYESIYHHVITGDYSNNDKGSIKKAILDAYLVLDEICCEWVFRPNVPYPVNIYGLNNMIKLFTGVKGKAGLYFTLNQDLFIERKFSQIEIGLSLPCINTIINGGNSNRTLNGAMLESGV